MKNYFTKLKNTDELDDLLARSNDEPVAIFKHSMTCPISASAFQEMKDYAGGVALVEVQNARDLSREIGDHTGVQHESPELLLRNGRRRHPRTGMRRGCG